MLENPTPHADVNALLRELMQRVQAILGDRLLAAYLFGSLACGDFDRDSDIDVLVVTDGEISLELFLALQAMHARIAQGDSWWATQLEISYIPRNALRHYDPADAVHPHLDRGRGARLSMERHDYDWVVQRVTLREHGITLAGPAPETLIAHVSVDDLRGAVRTLLWEWVASMLDNPVQLSRRGYQSYIVLTVCRMLYTLEHGTVASKRAAAAWAQEALGERWAPLIERAWVGRSTPDSEARPDDLSETLDLIRHALGRSRQ